MPRLKKRKSKTHKSPQLYLCCACRLLCPTSQFSKNQWKKGNERRCNICVSQKHPPKIINKIFNCKQNKDEDDLLISGYIRQIQMLLHHTIPKEIVKICYKYHNQPINSEILSAKECKIFSNLMKLSNQTQAIKKWKLLYRASRDGWDAMDFHKKCDNKGDTISIIHTDNNNVFGGYTTMSWKMAAAGQYIRDNHAFLMLIRSSRNYKPNIFPVKKRKRKDAIHLYWNSMCTYGSGFDISISSNCNKNRESYTDAYSYDLPSDHYLNGGKEFKETFKYFKVCEIEIFASG